MGVGRGDGVLVACRIKDMDLNALRRAEDPLIPPKNHDHTVITSPDPRDTLLSPIFCGHCGLLR